VQQVDKYPVLGELVTVTSVDIYDSHISPYVTARQAEKAASRSIRKVSPTKKAGVITFGETRDVAVEFFVFQLCSVGVLVLFLLTGNCVSRTDARRSVPDHVIVPGLRQQFGRASIVSAGIELAQVGDHAVDEVHRLLAFAFSLRID
jgi:hypothetical protein